MPVALPPGCGGDVGDAVADVRIERTDQRLTRLVLRRGAAVPHRGQRRRVAETPHDERVGNERTALHVHVRGAQLGFEPVGGGLARVRAQRHGRGLVHGDERGAGVVVAEVAGQPLGDPVGVRERDRVGRRLGPRRAEPGERAQHRVGEAARAAANAPRARRRSPTPRRAAARRAAAGTRRAAARRVREDPDGGAGASPRASPGRRADVARARCRRRGRW